MKRSLFFVIIQIITFYGELYSQNQWSWLNPSGTGNNLNAVDMVNANTGFAVGDAGTIIKTTNGGGSWQIHSTGINAAVYSLFAIDHNIAYAGSTNGIIFKTADGGNSWDPINTGTTYTSYGLHFINTNTGIAVCNSGKILRTTNAGLNWQLISSPVTNQLIAVDFINEFTGYAAGNFGVSLKTTDAGLSWISLPYITGPTGGGIINDIKFINEQTGYAVGGSRIFYKTTDGGTTNWQSSFIANELSAFYSITSSGDNLFASGIINSTSRGVIYNSTNAGANWNLVLDVPSGLKSLDFMSANTGIAVGNSGAAYKTLNTGINWHSLKDTISISRFETVFFVNKNVGYAYGHFPAAFIKTTDGGANWFHLQYPASSETFARGIYFLNETTGFAGGDASDLYYTTNGGTNWIPKNSGSFAPKSFEFVNQQTGYAAGGTGKIGKTTNGGQNWFTLPVINSNNNYYDISFINSNTGIAVGYPGDFIRTTNGGENWSVISSGYNDLTFSGVDFSGDTGIAVTALSGGVILRSTNAGLNWVSITPPSQFQWYTSVQFVTRELIYISGYNGILLKSTNAGLNWTQQTITNKNILDLHSSNEGDVYLSGYDGIILSGKGAGNTISGFVKYSDNNQSVSGGRVYSLKRNNLTNEVIINGSGLIQSDGSYIIPNVTNDTTYLIAYPNSNEDFVPTYYPSTIDWHTAVTSFTTGSLTNKNINVHRINSTSGTGAIRGKVFNGINIESGIIDYANIYAKISGQYKKFSSSISNGAFSLQNLSNGTYEIFTNRLGYENKTITLTVNGGIIDTNIYLYTITNVTENTIPSGYSLNQNYPNPFNPVTNIEFSIPKNSIVKLTVFDILGREIKTLVNEFKPAGNYTIEFDASRFSSGVYFYRLESGSYSNVRKMILLK